MKIIKTSLLIMIALAFGFGGLPAEKAEAAVDAWQQGAEIYPRWNTDFESESFRQSVNNLAATGANYVTLIIPLYQSNIHSIDINRGNNTPTDGAITSAIAHAKSLGMNVVLKPHAETYDGQWRAHINPSDRAGWFEAYGGWLEHYGRLAQANGVNMIVVGSELIDMATATSNPDNTSRWVALIERVRGVYSGKLTYSANWGGSWWADEKNHIEFWSSLDYIGLAAYFALDTGSANVDELKAKWDYWRTADIEPLQRKWGKPVLFTEIGYRSMNGARSQPFNSWDNWGANEWEQAQLYEALFSFWNNYNYMQGVHLWDWISDPNAGASWDQSYTPQHKQAEQVMKKWWSGAAPPPPQAEPSFTTRGSVSPQDPKANQSLTVNAAITNGTSSASGIIVNVEIYNEAGQKLHQSYFDGQTFAAGQTKNFGVQWTPSVDGNYFASVGVFSAGWTKLYVWHHAAVSFKVGSGTTPPPPPPPPPPPAGSSSIDIWWPTDGSAITGTTPFKAMLQNWHVDDHDMFWQVDGDRLNGMYTSHEDWPHKEAWVDVSGWNWKGSGPYVLNFVAKDKSGNVISQKSSTITVQ